VLGRTVVLKGELSFRESLVIKGQVHGSATGTASVLIEKTANVSGELSADLIQVQHGAPLDGVVLTGCIQRISNKKR
jgi:cytoskeletal protein CcmA (bactofilin family)